MVGEDRWAHALIAHGCHGRCERRWLHLLVTAPGSAVGGGPSSVTTVSWARGRKARGSRWGDSNSGPPPQAPPGSGCAGWLTCGSLAPVVTARARCTPLPTGSACTHRVPANTGPLRSWTPPALRSGDGDGIDRPPRARDTRDASCPILTISRAVGAWWSRTSPRRPARSAASSTKPATFTSPSSPGFRDGRNALVRWAVLLEEVLP